MTVGIPRRRLGAVAAGAVAAALGLASCSPGGAARAARSRAGGDAGLRVATTTGILADLARNVAGERAAVTQMVPDGADPHSWEPSLRAVRDVAYADLALTNYLLLEEHAIIRTLDANLPAAATSVSVAEEAAKQGATVLPLVEDRALDTAWLGLRVMGDGAALGATRASTVDLTVTGVDGPGDASGYLTTSFGTPEIGFASSDGFDRASGFAEDTSVLPADAHQHMSWAFTKPGVYRLRVSALLRSTPSAEPVPMGQGTVVFAVGIAPEELARAEGREVLSAGHADVAVDLASRRIVLAVDDLGGGAAGGGTGGAGTGLRSVELDRILIEVPPRTLTQVPGAPGFRFIGPPGSDVYLLPQAVLGKHVHGEIDPHLWHDVHNAAAYVRVIRDALIGVDPSGAEEYRRNAAAYLDRLEALDAEVAAVIGSIPAGNRRLVTTSDAYGYLARAYGLEVAGFVSPSPAVEPSVADRVRLAATIADLRIPAVFLEPNLARTRSTLRTVAEEAGVRVCPLYGDTLDRNAPTYIDMMRANARSLADGLGGEPGTPAPASPAPATPSRAPAATPSRAA